MEMREKVEERLKWVTPAGTSLEPIVDAVLALFAEERAELAAEVGKEHAIAEAISIRAKANFARAEKAEKRSSLFAEELEHDNSDWRVRAEQAEASRDALREACEKFVREYVVCPDDTAVVCPVLEDARMEISAALAGAAPSCEHVAPDSTTWCPECGPDVKVDEDGCCVSCGATATGSGARRANLAVRANERAPSREEKLVAAEKVIELMADDCKLTGWNQDTLRVYRAYKEEPK